MCTASQQYNHWSQNEKESHSPSFYQERIDRGIQGTSRGDNPKTRSEKGCLFYSLFQDVSSPGEFMFYEEYADPAALDVHFKSEYLGAFRKSVEGMHSKEKIVEVI